MPQLPPRRYRRSRFQTRKAGKTRRMARKSYPKGSGKLVRLIKSIVARGRENKLSTHQVEKTFHNSGITNADMYPVLPAVAFGADENNRIGSKINPKGLYIKGEISLDLDPLVAQINNPIRVRMIIACMRAVKQTNLLAGNFNSLNLLKSNDDATTGSTDVAYDGSVTNHMYPVNKDIYTVLKDIQFTLCPNNLIATGTGNEQPLYRASKFFNFKLKCPKTFTYDSAGGTQNWPTNFAPFCLIGYCYPDGSTPDTTRTRILTNIRSFLYFEDA